MDLRIAAQRYEEQRSFWAREIALVLQKPFYKSRLALLRQLVASGKPMTAMDMADYLPSQKGSKKNLASFASGLLKDFSTAGLVRRTRYQFSYWYTHTELAALVLAYLPIDERVAVRQPPPSSNGVSRETEEEEVAMP